MWLLLVFVLILPACQKDTVYDITTMNMHKYLTLSEYKGLTVNYNLASASDEAVEEQIKSLLISNSEKIAVKEGKAQKGDLVNINYVGYKDDVPFDGGTANSQNIRIGAGNYIPGFEEAIIGMTPGETVDANLTFPENYHDADLAGQMVVYSITLNFIYPEITDEVVAKMEKGIDTDVGEGGDLLSTGEKQLISFARAILADPRILVLDEATASVDTLTEQRIQSAIDTVIRGRTSLVIAHRLSTVRNADLILVVRDGKIVEQGTHEQLLAAKGAYYRLYTRQYEDEATSVILN